MKLLGRDEFLNGQSLNLELVEVPELQGSIYMRELGTPGVMKFNSRVKELQGGDEKKEIDFESSIELMALSVSLSACDEKGVFLFSESDVKQLTNNNLAMLLRLATKAMNISGLGMNTIGELTSGVAANLPKDPKNSSPTNSPKNSRKRKRK
ncbi:MAG TPA: hypothetical protein VIY48_09675 [Candidatus Paceibacterota bacterium]